VTLLEREPQLQQLAALFDAVASGGRGACALVLGGAGVGKTSLARQFVEGQRDRAEMYWGACEALFTPRPLGPISDIASELPPGLAAQVHAGSTYNGLFPAFLGFLRDRTRPVLLVIEDAHWADEATLDFIKYLGRRIDQTRTLLIVTLRDDELDLDHPLRRVLGDLPAAFTRRLPLAPLSRGAVDQLAREAGWFMGRTAGELHRLTGGNPFYVTELLAAPGDAIPASVRDAVLARVGHLGVPARRLVELVAIEPGRLERAIVDVLLPGADAAVRAASGGGVLRSEDGWLAFRHEIARQCIERELPTDRCAELHAQLLEALRHANTDTSALTRLVHHAIAAGRRDDVRELAPRAAAEAARLGSHREAASLYRRALATTTDLDAELRADLLEAAGDELQKTGALPEAIAVREEALALRRAGGDRLREGVNLRMLGVLHRQSSGDKREYLRFAHAAVDVLEPLGQPGELAKAYASLSHVHCLLSDFDTSIDWGARAVRLARTCGDPAALALALNRHAAAQLYKGNEAQARVQLEQALALAIDSRFEGLAAETFVSLQTTAVIYHDHAFALDVGRRGIAYCEARDLDGYALSLRFRCAYLLVNLGRWDEAEQEYARCATAPNVSSLVRLTCEYALRRQQLRRADLPVAAREMVALQGDVDDFWRAAQTKLRTLQVEHKPPAIAAHCVEAAWLRGDLAAAIDVARLGLAEALAAQDGRLAGPLLVWLARLGTTPPRFDSALQSASEHELAGDRAAAAAEWERLNNPFERALVLAFGDEDDMRAAARLFDALGAERAVAATRTRMRAQGVRGIERGPYAHARGNEFGLTRRENDIAELLCQGLSNAAIAQRLHRSERTVEHHVASVLAKLGVASRAQALVKLSSLRQTAEN